MRSPAPAVEDDGFDMMEISTRSNLRGAEAGANSSFARTLNRLSWLVCVCWCGLTLTGFAAAPFREVPAPYFGQIKPPAPPPAPKPVVPDELLFEDGDRVRGEFIEREGDILSLIHI